MVILLLPLVTAILLLVQPPPKYASPQSPNAMQIAMYQRLSDAGLKENELATVAALTLGHKAALDKELRHHFQAAGAAHVLAVSGLHTGIIYALLLGIMTLGGYYKPLHDNKVVRRTISLIIIVAMWLYAWLTGMTPSVVRAVLMLSIFEFGRMAYRQALSLNTVAAAAVLILLVHPTDLWSVSFQLSFAATAAIIVVMTHIAPALQVFWPRHPFWTKSINVIVGTLLVTLAAQLGTLPITIYYFHQVSTYFLLTNCIVLPLATLLVPCGLISLALGGTLCGIWFTKITSALAWALNHSVGWIESLPCSTFPAHIPSFSSTASAHTSLPFLALYYLLFILLCITLSSIAQRDQNGV